MFKEGASYRRRDLHKQYGGQQQGGISTPSQYPFIMLFTGSTGELYGYKDGWETEDTFRYYGEGQYGDMQFVRGNRAIRNHSREGKQLHLFERLDGGMARYLSEMTYEGYRTERGKDLAGEERLVIVFDLRRVPSRNS
jgi:5-methylcytosine-specific restriction enzyme A